MSDGPHRTLPMRHPWKQLAKRADKSAYDSQDVIDAICPALEQDWAYEIPKEFMKQLRSFCADQQPSMFGDYKDGDLEKLKRLTAGRGSLGGAVADFAAQALADGKSGDDAVHDAVHQALNDRVIRNARSMEEHYCRESSTRRAADVRSRLENGINRAPIGALAGRLVSGIAASTAAPPKHQGLDDGVGLP